MQGITKEQLESFSSRILTLHEEEADVKSDIKSVYAEAKKAGINKKALKKVITIAKQKRKNADAAEELEDIVETYRDMLSI